MPGPMTRLFILSQINPEETAAKVRETMIECCGNTHEMAESLGVSYATLLRSLDRLEMREEVRKYWAEHKKPAKPRKKAKK